MCDTNFFNPVWKKIIILPWWNFMRDGALRIDDLINSLEITRANYFPQTKIVLNTTKFYGFRVFLRLLNIIENCCFTAKSCFYADIIGFIIITRNEIVWKRRNFFCLCNVPDLIGSQSFRKGTKSNGKFQ